MTIENFRTKLREYLRLGGYSQKQLAYELGLHPAQLSNKLNNHNNASLTHAEVKQLVKILAGWEILTSQSQALELLASMNLNAACFSVQEWQAPPLIRLELSTQAQSEPWKVLKRVNQSLSSPQAVPPRLVVLPPPTTTRPVPPDPKLEQDSPSLPLQQESVRRENWPGISSANRPVYGREKELNTLQHWVLEEHCQVIALLGMGGIGKTTLSVKLYQQLKDHFDFVVWHSLYNAPPLETLLREILQFLVAPLPLQLSGGTTIGLQELIAHLQKSRVLLVLDNWETVLQGEKLAGAYRSGYEDYTQLLEQIAQTSHQSCLILTSREKPQELGILEAKVSGIHSLNLAGLALEEAKPLLRELKLEASPQGQQALVERYRGNPLALKLVAEPLQTLFGGRVEAFLAEEWTVFGEIEEVVAQQLKRLDELERQLIYWLAIEREPISLQQLHQNLVSTYSLKQVAETLISLSRRNLLEREAEYDQPCFSLQPVLLEYLTEQMVKQACAELVSGQPRLLYSHALLKAQAKDYVKDSQRRLIVRPVLERLLTHFAHKTALQTHLTQILSTIRERPFGQQGYAGGNIINLLGLLQGNLNGYDFSRLRVWQADLQGIELHGVNFAGADLGRSTFTQAFDSITSIVFSPDGRLMAGGCYSGEVRVWEVASGQQLLECKGHRGVVWTVAFSPDGRLVASGSLDQTIKLWKVESGECLRTLEGHSNWVWAAAFSPDGQLLVSGSLDQTAKLWEVASGRCLKTLQGHTNAVWAVSFSPDGQRLVSGSSDHTLKLWEVAGGTCLYTFEGHNDWVMSVAFSPDGHTLASGGNDQTIKLWEVTSGACLKTLLGHTGTTYTLAFNWDGRLLASGSLDQTIKLWEVANGKCLRTLQGHTSWVWTVAFSPDGKILASGGTDQSIKMWEVDSGICLTTLQGYTNWVYTVAFSPDGQLLASGSTDHTVKLWKLDGGTYLKTLEGHTDTIMSVTFSPDGKLLASSSLDRTIRLWEMAGEVCIRTLQGHTDSVWTVAFSPDGQILASGSADYTIKLWEVATGQCFQSWSVDHNWIYSVAFSPDGKLLASGSLDRTVRVWEVASGICLKTLEGHSNEVRSVAFSPDGKLLASGSIDRSIRLWEVASGVCLKTLEGHSNWVYAVAFSPDGKLLVSGGTDQTLKLWEVDSGSCLRTIVGHTKLVRTVAFSSDGQTLASAGNDQTIRLWEVASGQCLKTLRALRPYEQMNISGVTGITEAQRANLEALGALSATSLN